jgi:hypothetical protein
MIEPAAVAALAAVAGGVVAVTARSGRTIALGLAVAFAAAPLAASPLPGQLGLFARIAGAVLAADLLWVGTRVNAVRSEGSAIGPAAEAAIAAAAFLIGLWVVPVKPLPGPATEQAAGLALVALAVIPLVGRDVLRLGIGAALLAVGLLLLREAWLGPAPAFEHFTVAALLVGILGATSLLVVPLPEWRDDAESDAAEEGMTALGAVTGAASAGAVTGAAGPTSERAPSVASAPAAVDYLDDVPDAADAEIEVPLPRPSPRSGSMVRRTRNPRGSEPRQ